MMHDMALTQNHALLLDVPLLFEPQARSRWQLGGSRHCVLLKRQVPNRPTYPNAQTALCSSSPPCPASLLQRMIKEKALPFRFDSRPVRIGVLPRSARSADEIRWFETGGCARSGLKEAALAWCIGSVYEWPAHPPMCPRDPLTLATPPHPRQLHGLPHGGGLGGGRRGRRPAHHHPPLPLRLPLLLPGGWRPVGGTARRGSGARSYALHTSPACWGMLLGDAAPRLRMPRRYTHAASSACCAALCCACCAGRHAHRGGRRAMAHRGAPAPPHWLSTLVASTAVLPCTVVLAAA